MRAAELPPLDTTGYRHLDLEAGDLQPVGTIFKARTGRRLNPATLWRWVRKGNRGVRLEAVQISAVWHTTAHAFAMFLAGQTAARLTPPVPETVPTERDERTTRKLRAAGLIK